MVAAALDRGTGRLHGVGNDRAQLESLLAQLDLTLLIRATSIRSSTRRAKCVTCRSAIARSASWSFPPPH